MAKFINWNGESMMVGASFSRSKCENGPRAKTVVVFCWSFVRLVGGVYFSLVLELF